MTESNEVSDPYDPFVCSSDVDLAALCDDASVMPLLRDDDRPIFNDSWEAEALAIVRVLVSRGAFSAREWYDVISAEIRAAQERGDPDRGDTYYQHWMRALERITIEHGIIDPGTLVEHQRLWSLAVANTPHGSPILFEYAFAEPVAGHEHEHAHATTTEDPLPLVVHRNPRATSPS